MGQQQSSSGDQAVVKTSYYEVLGVSKASSEDDIKKAYRRKAFELHPDRNYGNVGEATRLFAEVQEAYEVLSDPQERAWYDSHENAVLSDQHPMASFGSGVPVTSSEDIAKLYSNFAGRNDFSDSPGGFFSYLRNVFDNLSREEQLASENADLNIIDFPDFGSSQDDYYEVVKPFYDVWSSFSTRKSFAWKDIYRLSEAPDRRVRRAMEKENRRLRDEAIEDFNDTVRTLVAFVKKRDPRQRISQVTDKQRQQALRDQSATQAAKARAANQASLGNQIVPEWVTVQGSDGEAPEEFWDEAQDELDERFECVVCDKFFKSEKQYETHARSKKHDQAVKKIQRQMRKEGIDFGLDSQRAVRSEKEDTDVTDHPKGDQIESKDILGKIQNSTENNSLTSDNELYIDEQDKEVDSAQADSQDDGDYAPRDIALERLAGVEALHIGSSDEENDKKAEKPKAGKAKTKRARRANRETKRMTQVLNLSCKSCTQEFPSKSQLFAHLKGNPSHVQPVVDKNV